MSIKKTVTRLFTAWIIVMMGFLMPLQTVQAAMISAATQLSAEQTIELRSHLDRALASKETQQQLVDLGVDVDDAKARLAALTDAEIQLINEELDELPKGGVLGLLGAVFVVLVVLELLGVTDVFKKI